MIIPLLILMWPSLVLSSAVRLVDSSNRTLVIYRDQECIPKKEAELETMMKEHFLPTQMSTTAMPPTIKEAKPTTGFHDELDIMPFPSQDGDLSEPSPWEALGAKATVLETKPPSEVDDFVSLEDIIKSPVDVTGKQRKQRRKNRRRKNRNRKNRNRKKDKKDKKDKNKNKDKKDRNDKKDNKRKQRDLIIKPLLPKNPPWHCEMKALWLQMPKGYFPPYIRSGKCTQTTCMLNMYQCTPKYYVIKVLRRNPIQCNPIPSVGTNTTYEEVWEFVRQKIIVCCECSRKTIHTRGRLP